MINLIGLKFHLPSTSVGTGAERRRIIHKTEVLENCPAAYSLRRVQDTEQQDHRHRGLFAVGPRKEGKGAPRTRCHGPQSILAWKLPGPTRKAAFHSYFKDSSLKTVKTVGRRGLTG